MRNDEEQYYGASGAFRCVTEGMLLVVFIQRQKQADRQTHRPIRLYLGIVIRSSLLSIMYQKLCIEGAQ